MLYATFLGNVFKDSFMAVLPEGLKLSDEILNGLVGGQLMSSILAVSCVTVAFCSNMLMVQDKVNGSIKDLTISPVKSSTLALSYYFATLVSTLIICLSATAICLVYVASIGWFMSACDVLMLVLDVFLLVMFGTALSSVIHFFLSSQGQMSAVGTIISAGYGFICGAYMPISSFSEGLQKVLSFLPGTYGTSLVRSHSVSGTFEEMKSIGLPDDAINSMKDGIDCNMYFFGREVDTSVKYLVLVLSTVVLIAIYVALNANKRKKRS